MSRLRRESAPKGASMSRLGLVEVLWQRLVSTRAIGAMWMIAGSLLLLAPFARLPARLPPRWFEEAMQSAQTLQVAVLLLATSLPLLLGLWFRRRDDAQWPDVVLSRSSAEDATSTGWQAYLPALSLGLLALGALGVVGVWLSIQRDVPAARAPFSLEQKTEFVSARVGGRPVSLMLPRRVQVSELVWSTQEVPSVSVSFSRPGQQDLATPQKLELGQSVDVGGKRFTFSGIQEDTSLLRAVLSSSAPNTIPASGTVGSSIKLAIDGPSFTVRDMQLNYLGLMGPAVQLESEQTGAFWVFMRAPKQKIFAHDLTLERLETAPAVIMTIAPVAPFEPLVVFGLVFIAGLGLLLTLPHTRRHGKRALVSFNEAGALAASFAPARRDLVLDEEE